MIAHWQISTSYSGDKKNSEFLKHPLVENCTLQVLSGMVLNQLTFNLQNQASVTKDNQQSSNIHILFYAKLSHVSSYDQSTFNAIFQLTLFLCIVAICTRSCSFQL